MSERRVARRGTALFMLAGDEFDDPELSRLEAALEIDSSDLPAALVEQAALYYRARLMAARLEAAAQAAQAEADAAEARVAAWLRDQAGARGEVLSEVSLGTRARVHADVDRPARRALVLRGRLGISRALMGAYEQRMRALEVLGALTRGGDVAKG